MDLREKIKQDRDKWFMFIMILMIFSCQDVSTKYYQCITDRNVSDAVKAYTVEIDDPESIDNPGLVILVRGVDENEGFVLVNEKRFTLPPLPGGASQTKPDENMQGGKEGWYRSESSNELLGKVIVPLPGVSLKKGENKIVFDKTENSDGYRVTDARLKSVAETEPKIDQLTYRVVTRGEEARIDDFDFVVNYSGEGKRKKSDLPDWAKRGEVRYYRAGINFNNLDRLFEMFKEGHFNLVMLQVSTPHDTTGEEYQRYKAFIDRCHANGIRVTFDGGAGGQPIRLNSISADSVLAHPEMEAWLSRDEYGEPRWRRRDSSYWPDLNNQDYRNRVLETASMAIDAGVDELYYDWAIGGTKGIVRFFRDVQDLISRKGKNLTVFGNCKGNMIADDICDIEKSEGTEEAGVWDGRWVHNTTQAKFYYAAGDGWKPYRSKYEGADRGNPNPGAHSVIDDMKIGWKRPMAEAKAFQSDFVIAEAGRRMLNGWLQKNDPIAMNAWNDICQYNGFFATNEQLFTDVTTVSRVGVLAPPVIPSFEASIKRIQLYNALIEMNIMFDILLLPKLTPTMLAGYDVIIVPDIPWLNEKELAAVKAYQERGGKLYVMGSSTDLQKLATVTAPAYLCHNTQQNEVQQEFLSKMNELLPHRIIQLQNGEYVLANVVRKTGSDQIIVHFVNYLSPLKNVGVKLNLEGVVDSVDKDKIKFFSPDLVESQLNSVEVSDKNIEFIIPELEIYDIVTIN